MNCVSTTFLTAEWRDLVMLNYAVDRELLEPLVPPSLELDAFDAVTYISVVGFLFLRTRIFGIAFPFHRDFEEVNLRLYVRHRAPDGWRRGVVFVKELVPRRAIAVLARAFYGEPYSACPMSHSITAQNGERQLRYEWQRSGLTEFIAATVKGEPALVAEGSIEEFITEHYWGYNGDRGRCTEYQVEHPKWRVWPATNPQFSADLRRLYGEDFVKSFSVAPASAFVAEGSAVVVRRGAPLSSKDAL